MIFLLICTFVFIDSSAKAAVFARQISSFIAFSCALILNELFGGFPLKRMAINWNFLWEGKNPQFVNLISHGYFWFRLHGAEFIPVHID
jgi:hypothetical protein